MTMSRILTVSWCLAVFVAQVHTASIVFPETRFNVSRPQLVFKEEPDCAKDSEFGLCESEDFRYPENVILEALASGDNTLVSDLARGDELTDELVGRFGGSNQEDLRLVEETAACTATESIIYPKMAKNENNDWLFVVNTEQASQAIRVEKCVDEGQPCRIGVEGTACRQKYIYRKMIAINGAGKMSSENFRIPSCCVCYVKNEFLIVRGLQGKRRKAKPASAATSAALTEAAADAEAEAEEADVAEDVAKSRPARQAGDEPEIEVVGGETDGLSGSPLDNALDVDERPDQGTAQQSIETEETFNPSDTIGGNPVGRFAGEIIVHSQAIVVQKKPKPAKTN